MLIAPAAGIIKRIGPVYCVEPVSEFVYGFIQVGKGGSVAGYLP